MPVKTLKNFLDSNHVKYISISHSPAYSAQAIAALAHIPGQELAKTVIVKIDDRFAMAVLPASFLVDIGHLKAAVSADHVRLASEDEFASLFPDCEMGAMPPFGNLYGMDEIISEELTKDDEIVFNAGTHTDLIKMKFSDFEKLVHPRIVNFKFSL